MFANSSKQDSSHLAILGGQPIHQGKWPLWPRADENTENLIKDVLYSNRWTITGSYTGKKSYERQFAEAFAQFYTIPYCVPTTNGSAALTIALEALNVGQGQEVLIPGISWVACAASVVSLGAIPVLVDVEPDTLCMSIADAESALNEKTSAIMLVHQNCSLANVTAFVSLSRQKNIPILEDCSQAHGAFINGQRIGTFGQIAAFSMQQNKLLACGEGGAVITSDIQFYDRLQQLRANGRRYVASPTIGQLELEEVGSIMGDNYILSEFHSAILLDRLQYLDRENETRNSNVQYLNSLLKEIGGIVPLCNGAGQGRLTYHKYTVRLSLDEFGNTDIRMLARAISAELNFLIGVLDEPLNSNQLFNAQTSPRLRLPEKIHQVYDPKRFILPIATKATQECLIIRHHAFLGTKQDMEDIARAFAKVKKWSHSLRNKEK